MKTLLFIGGTGFLGKSFFDYINGRKLKNIKLSKIIIISRKRKKIQSRIKISYIKKNITNINKIPITDYIIYAANSDNNKENLNGFYNFKRLINVKHKKTKILFTSSGVVYGPKKTKNKIKETDLINFKNVSNFTGYKKEYAKSKIIMENELKRLGDRGFNVSIARLFSFIGKRILINKNFAITNLINQSQNKKKNEIVLNSNTDVFRGYMNEDDLIRWILKILDNANPNSNIYNVGSDESVTIKSLAKIIGKKYDKKIVFSQKNKQISNKKNIDYYVPSISKAKKELNLRIKYKLKDSLNQIINLK